MTASLFGVGNTINVNVNGTLVPQSFTGTAGQTVFTITSFVYTINTNSLLVFINGQKQISGKDFTETSSTSFTLVEGVVVGDVVEIIGFPQINLTAVTAGVVTLGGAYTLQAYVTDTTYNVKNYPYLAQGNGITDDTAAIQSCINAASAAGVGVLIPAGTYPVNSVSIPSNTYIIGAGIDKSIIKQISGANDALHTADPGSGTTFTSNVTLRNFTLKGTVATDGFQQVLHLMFTQGASDLTIEYVKFTGMRGDGLYIGTGNERGQAPTQVRHNQRVKVLNCIFDGEVKNNRNGISVEDCDGCWIQNSYFTRLSQSGMPGPIDIENDSVGTPAGSGAVLSNINVLDNKFYDNSGSGQINVNLHYAQSAMTIPVRGINIIGNFIDTALNVGISLIGAAATITDSPHVIEVRDNFVRNLQNPFIVQGLRGVRLHNNYFAETQVGATVGDVAAVKNAVDVDITGNTLYKVAVSTGGGTAINVYGMTRFLVSTNIFDTIGRADNAANYGIDFLGAAAQTYCTVEDNLFTHPTSNGNAYDVRNDGGGLSATTFRHTKNRLINYAGAEQVFNNALTPDDWQPLSLLNSWVANGGNSATPQFSKDSAGWVHLRGTIKSGTTTAGLSLCNIPAGFRPGTTLEFVVYNGTGSGFLQAVYSNGDLQIIALVGNTILSLNGISWKAEV